MIITTNTKAFATSMNNIMEYAVGFMDGVQRGKQHILKAIGMEAIDLLKDFIDANARTNPAALHHVYEWYQTGSPNARLFDITYTMSNVGLSIKSTFRQSTSIKDGSTVPFYDKARIIENGIPVVIRPRRSSTLVFEDGGETVFTKQPIVVENPGGTEAQNGFEQVFDSFFNNYFSQAFLRVSGIMDYLENPEVFKKNINAGKRGGRSLGVATGYSWVANVGVKR